MIIIRVFVVLVYVHIELVNVFQIKDFLFGNRSICGGLNYYCQLYITYREIILINRNSTDASKTESARGSYVQLRLRDTNRLKGEEQKYFV